MVKRVIERLPLVPKWVAAATGVIVGAVMGQQFWGGPCDGARFGACASLVGGMGTGVPGDHAAFLAACAVAGALSALLLRRLVVLSRGTF